MDNHIHHIYIRNFKSIRECDIDGCKRINLFIGRPNVGKSNILEALSLFSIPFLKENSSKKLSNLVRVENEPELFYNGDTNMQSCVVRTNIAECILNYGQWKGLTAGITFPESEVAFKTVKGEDISLQDDGDFYKIDDKLNVRGLHGGPINSPIKRYTFKPNVKYKSGHAKYLIPPFGLNLLNVILNYKELKEDVASFFGEYRLNVAFDKTAHTIKVIQQTPDGIFLIPYNSIADTLQRIIFYKAAIASNTNSVLLFEEPEAHSFPPYMSHLTQEMIYRKDNQFFVATHSPFILNDLLENGMDELAVFIVYYEDGETKLRPLSRQELREAYQNGVDFFTNSESFFTHG